MDRGAWGSAVHGIAESDTTERITLPSLKSYLNARKKCAGMFTAALTNSKNDKKKTIGDLLSTFCTFTGWTAMQSLRIILLKHV